MGIYLNPNNENFRKTLASGTYVDKTMMITEINRFIDTGNSYVCVSRPRRFGKTIAGNMLCAYYSKGCDSRELFAPYKIAQVPGFEDKLNKYNVIQIDLNGEFRRTLDSDTFLKKFQQKIIKEFQREFPDVSIENGDSLAEAILTVYSITGETFIILIDEYDVLVREKAEEGLFHAYLNFLNGLFKDNTLRPAIALAYLTGILPIVRDKIQSKLNVFEEYTILDAGELAPFIGFTDEEVNEICHNNNMDYEECKRWYDGYSQYGLEIYNPVSVMRAMKAGRYGNYWSKTASYAAISDQIELNFDGTKDAIIRMLSGERVDVDVLSFLNTMDHFTNRNDIFTYLIHLGYLAYDFNDETARIPNREIQSEWQRAIAANADYKVTNDIIAASKELLSETIAGNEEAVRAALDVSHIHVTSNRSYNNEDALQSAIYLAYIYALNQYTIIREMISGKGYADVVFIPFVPDKPAMIIELKRNSSKESALNQIRNRQYFDSLSHYQGALLFVGVNYDEKEKTHSCKIERFTIS
ncbi:MAG: ATP-binding protein [Lachnospiraceae bacterium]|nr:ATP-binding protein [Lachnospiraceae bacterium]